ncbi:acylphosphatase [Gemmatimonas sp.]|jgi:acylphosphatase|uniref:acylphosphatase n=1 Tax=Gemmatimonas sp. TaxID=1962908 RepID=UPI0037C11652
MALAVRRYRVEGEVQGVGFRWYVREQARSLELAGWVRNEPDGAVVLVASGEATALDVLERQLKIGPRHSMVTDVVRRELTSFDAAGLPSLFLIER